MWRNEFQNFHTKSGALIPCGFPVAGTWCRFDPMTYGYARVSTDGQGVDTQMPQVRATGAGQLFRETASRAKADRAQLRRLLGQLAAGDVLMVTRLGDQPHTLATVADCKAGFGPLGGTRTETTTAHGRLMPTVLGRSAGFERELIRARTTEGRRYGRGQRREAWEAIRRPDQSEETLREVARSYNVSQRTISRP